MWRVLERMARGEAKKSEIDMLLDVSHQVEGHKAGTFSPKEKALCWQSAANPSPQLELPVPWEGTGLLVTTSHFGAGQMARKPNNLHASSLPIEQGICSENSDKR